MRLLCWINDSSTARHAAGLAAELARRAAADLRYVDATPVELRQIVEHGEFDLVVMEGTPRGRFASVLGGVMSTRLAQRASVPVLVVPPGTSVSALDRVVLAYDLGAPPARAASVAGKLAAALWRSPNRGLPAMPSWSSRPSCSPRRSRRARDRR